MKRIFESESYVRSRLKLTPRTQARGLDDYYYDSFHSQKVITYYCVTFALYHFLNQTVSTHFLTIFTPARIISIGEGKLLIMQPTNSRPFNSFLYLRGALSKVLFFVDMIRLVLCRLSGPIYVEMIFWDWATICETVLSRNLAFHIGDIPTSWRIL